MEGVVRENGLMASNVVERWGRQPWYRDLEKSVGRNFGDVISPFEHLFTPCQVHPKPGEEVEHTSQSSPDSPFLPLG